MAESTRIRIYVKKRIEVSHLNFNQTAMLKLGNVGLASRKLEISQAKNATGGSAKPLKRGYAIYKTRFTKRHFGYGRNKRDLNLTGQLMREWNVRTVSENQAVMSWSTQGNRDKARGNNENEEFISWSPENARVVIAAARVILASELQKLVAAA